MIYQVSPSALLVLLLINNGIAVRDVCTDYIHMLKKAYEEYDEAKYFELETFQTSICLFFVDVLNNPMKHNIACERDAGGNIPFIKENSSMHKMILNSFQVPEGHQRNGYFIKTCENCQTAGVAAIQKTKHVNGIISIYNENASGLSLGTLCQFPARPNEPNSSLSISLVGTNIQKLLYKQIATPTTPIIAITHDTAHITNVDKHEAVAADQGSKGSETSDDLTVILLGVTSLMLVLLGFVIILALAWRRLRPKNYTGSSSTEIAETVTRGNDTTNTSKTFNNNINMSTEGNNQFKKTGAATEPPTDTDPKDVVIPRNLILGHTHTGVHNTVQTPTASNTNTSISWYPSMSWFKPVPGDAITAHPNSYGEAIGSIINPAPSMIQGKRTSVKPVFFKTDGASYHPKKKSANSSFQGSTWFRKGFSNQNNRSGTSVSAKDHSKVLSRGKEIADSKFTPIQKKPDNKSYWMSLKSMFTGTGSITEPEDNRSMYYTALNSTHDDKNLSGTEMSGVGTGTTNNPSFTIGY